MSGIYTSKCLFHSLCTGVFNWSEIFSTSFFSLLLCTVCWWQVMIKSSVSELNIESVCSWSGWWGVLGRMLQRRERLCRNPHHRSLSLAHPGPPLKHLQSVCPCFLFFFSSSMISAVFTWWSSSWTCPCWRWRRGALSCWAGVGVSWRGGGRGWVYWQAGVCSCRPEPQYGRHCGCSSLMWRLSTPGKPLLQAAWPWTNPTMWRKNMWVSMS